MPQCGQTEMQVTAMRRIERPAQEPDAAMPQEARTPTDPTLRVGALLSRRVRKGAGPGLDPGEPVEGQGRTWPLPRTRYL